MMGLSTGTKIMMIIIVIAITLSCEKINLMRCVCCLLVSNSQIGNCVDHFVDLQHLLTRPTIGLRQQSKSI